MNPAHIHLLTNHLPVLGVPFGAAVLLYGLWRRSDDVKRLGLLVLVLCAAGAVPVYLTGLWAEEQVEKIPGVSSGLVDAHHDAATTSLAGAVLLGCVALVSLLLYSKRRDAARALLWTSLVGALAVAGLMAWTANLGGQIRHPEIRSVK